MEHFRTERRPIDVDRCRHITSKGMRVFGEDYQTPVDETERTTDFWCVQTQSVLGPDGALVMLSRCSQDRRCYEGL